MFGLSPPRNDSVCDAFIYYNHAKRNVKKKVIATSALLGALLPAGDADYLFKEDKDAV